MMDAKSFSSSIRTWRTAFLTLRDETTLSLPPSTSFHSLLHDLLFSQSQLLIAAAADLPPHEVTSDILLLLQLSTSGSSSSDADNTNATLLTFHLMHDVSRRTRLEMNSSSSWATLLEFLENTLTCLFAKASKKKLVLSGTANDDRTNVIMEMLELLRSLVDEYGRKCLVPENTRLLKLLLHIVTFSISELLPSTCSSGNQLYDVVDTKTKIPNCHNLWECQIITFGMIEETLTRIGSSLSPEMWQLTIEVLRKVMDALVSKSMLVEDSAMSRFYTSLLRCLHLVLSDPRGSLSEHVVGFVAALRMFFVYGLTNRLPIASPHATRKEKDSSYISHKLSLEESAQPERNAYKPPHLRRKEGKRMLPLRASDSQSLSNNEPRAMGFSSSDSEHSDNDGLGKDMDYVRSSKTRLAAIICIQDLCQVDPKAVTAHLTMFLPTNFVLQTRKYEATVMTCLLFDPVLKVRIASASALAAVLTGPSSVFLQVAEYKESTKCGSFTALSSSLGQILMQLHSGILHLIRREVHSGLLASLFKVLMLLLSATPYARMPGELLPSVISTLRFRMLDGFPSRTDQTGLMAILLNCLGAAFSTSPPSMQVRGLLREELSTDLAGAPGKQSILSLIFQFAECATNPTLSFEALQVLRAVSHNYPNIMADCWGQVSTITYGILRVTTAGLPSSESSSRLLKGDNGKTVGSLGERCIMASVKVLDESLRAISGFKGTEDVLDDRSLETPFTSDSTRTKRISSAPSYGLDGPEFSNGTLTEDSSGSKQWCEVIEKHLPMILLHSSAMVRAASVTCFAGITSSVFFSLTKEKQDFILSSSISAALSDEVPSVRSAACRAIGVIACFPHISQRAEILDKFISAIETNTRDPLVSVRITASWALANICDLLRHRASDFHLDVYATDIDSKTYSHWVVLLAECALRLSKDGDKIKSNAVRALGNLSRFVRFTSTSKSHYEGSTSREFLEDPHWLGRMVQAFVSCVTTGNVKVRWNVCHALSNLFLNETLKLEDMTWAPSVFSVLLLLLRDSSNYKIRIHAAAALAVPSSRVDYGTSFSDVVQGLQHVLETTTTTTTTTTHDNEPPSSFKYRDALEKQLTSSCLHVLSLVSYDNNQEGLRDFLVKKASFLEEWLTSLSKSVEDEKKMEMVERATRSLLDVYNKHHQQQQLAAANRFQNLLSSLSN